MSESKAALSAEEWARVVAAIRRLVEIGYNRGGGSYTPSETQEVADAAMVDAYLLDAVDDNQPFGFTWEDVRRHREAATTLRDALSTMDHVPQELAIFTESIEWHESLAARIAALLR